MATSKFNESQALDCLSAIKDPLTGQDIISAGRLADIIRLACEAALKTLAGVKNAQVILTAHEAGPTLQSQRAAPRPKTVRPHKASRPEGYQGDSQVKHVVAISSAKGGVGKSTIAINLAVALAKTGNADFNGAFRPKGQIDRGKRASDDRTL